MNGAPNLPEISSWPGEIPIQSSYTAGPTGQKFFDALKKDGKLLASRCADCRQVYFPPRQFCERCFEQLSEAVEIAHTGTVASFTLCYVDRDRAVLRAPLALALVRLDGATTLFLHRLLDVSDWREVAIGAKVEMIVKAKEARAGSILDIEGFRLVPPSAGPAE